MKSHNQTASKNDRAKSWIQTHRLVLKFFFIFIISMIVFSYILQQESVHTFFILPHLCHVAWICGNIMNLFGTQCYIFNSSISTSRFAIEIVKGCESIYPTVMLWSAVLASPALWRWKIMGILGGAVILFILNIVRVITMFYIGTYSPSLFETVHIYAWQALFIFLTLAVFLFWAAKALQTKTTVNS